MKAKILVSSYIANEDQQIHRVYFEQDWPQAEKDKELIERAGGNYREIKLVECDVYETGENDNQDIQNAKLSSIISRLPISQQFHLTLVQALINEVAQCGIIDGEQLTAITNYIIDKQQKS